MNAIIFTVEGIEKYSLRESQPAFRVTLKGPLEDGMYQSQMFLQIPASEIGGFPIDAQFLLTKCPEMLVLSQEDAELAVGLLAGGPMAETVDKVMPE